jgi:hypothetical protein
MYPINQREGDRGEKVGVQVVQIFRLLEDSIRVENSFIVLVLRAW